MTFVDQLNLIIFREQGLFYQHSVKQKSPIPKKLLNFTIINHASFLKELTEVP
ncbi:hypothetical protein [Nostoc sp.]